MKLRTAFLGLFFLTVSWYYAAAYWAQSGRGFPVEFYPFWNASRTILEGSDPYGQATTQQNQIAAYGATVGSLGVENEQRFAYPVYATIPLLPLGYLNFPVANSVAFAVFAALTLLSVGWLRRRWDWTTVIYCGFTLCGFPIIYDLCARQPTLLFFGFAAASVALARSGRLIAAGISAGLSLGKPQLALSIVLAELIWTSADWQQRKRFAASVAGSALSLFALSWLLSPNWPSRWLSTLQAYTRYNKPSIVVSVFGESAGLAVSTLMLAALAFALWRGRRSELLLLAALSAAVVQLLIPYANYNAVMLLIPTIWILDNGSNIGALGELDRFMLGVTRVALVLFLVINPLGAVLLHTSQAGRFIAWVLPSLATHALLFCLVGTIITCYVTLLLKEQQHGTIAASSASQ